LFWLLIRLLSKIQSLKFNDGLKVEMVALHFFFLLHATLTAVAPSIVCLKADGTMTETEQAGNNSVD
jgi:hypothetical protein